MKRKKRSEKTPAVTDDKAELTKESGTSVSEPAVLPNACVAGLMSSLTNAFDVTKATTFAPSTVAAHTLGIQPSWLAAGSTIASAIYGTPASLHTGITSVVVPERWERFLPGSGIESGVLREEREREVEIASLRRNLQQKLDDIARKDVDLKQKQSELAQLNTEIEALREKERSSHLRSRVSPAAWEHLRPGSQLRELFSSTTAVDGYVLSIDLRRSTELMLKAREPRVYATFLLELAVAIRDVVLSNYGVFDKFTGDGALAFFPVFFSGPDAGLWAVRAALQSHEAFKAHYDRHRTSFSAVLMDVGLGIGIDFGALNIVELASELTVVGTPVVYACRMSGAEAGQTLVNQPAYEALFSAHAEFCDFRAGVLEVKHEGRLLAYELTASGKPFAPNPPPWAELPLAK